MKMHCLGVKRVKGLTSVEKGGNPFDMCYVVGRVAIENGGTERVKISGFGFETSDIDLDPDSIQKFSNVPFPCDLDLETDVVAKFGKFQTVVVGFKPIAAVAQPAQRAA